MIHLENWGLHSQGVLWVNLYLGQTNISGTIIKFIANYIKGRKAYTTYRNHTSKQRQFNTGIPQGGVLSPTLVKIQEPMHPELHHST